MSVTVRMVVEMQLDTDDEAEVVADELALLLGGLPEGIMDRMESVGSVTVLYDGATPIGTEQYRGRG